MNALRWYGRHAGWTLVKAVMLGTFVLLDRDGGFRILKWKGWR